MILRFTCDAGLSLLKTYKFKLVGIYKIYGSFTYNPRHISANQL